VRAPHGCSAGGPVARQVLAAADEHGREPGAYVARGRVLAARGGWPGPAVWRVLRRHPVTGELKTSLCTPLATLVRLSGRRWPIETCCEDGQQSLGMGDYEVRSWRGWHPHMTLVILAQFFLVRLRLRVKKLPLSNSLIFLMYQRRYAAADWRCDGGSLRSNKGRTS
jgi:hypothetical protein